MKLIVPELSMRNRLKRSVIATPSKTLKKPAPATTDTADDDAGSGRTTITPPAVPSEPGAYQPVRSALCQHPQSRVRGEGPHLRRRVTRLSRPSRPGKAGADREGTSRRLDIVGVVRDEGHLMNAGGHVYALDWAPIRFT